MPKITTVRLAGLERRRRRAMLTQDELAARAGVSRMVVSRLERGGEARLSTARKLASALECSFDDLTLVE
jgi:predicted transcriptional regulator